MKKFYRIKENSLVGGVCTGIAEYFGIKELTWVIRLFFILFSSGISILFYITLLLIAEEK